MPSRAPIPADPAPIKVLLVGRRTLSLAGLRALIDTQPDLEVVGQTGDAPAPVTRSQPTADVAVIDHGVRENLASLRALVDVSNHRPHTIVLTNKGDDQLLSGAFRAGARGVVCKSDAPDALVGAIRRVHAGDVWLDPARTGSLINSLLRGDDRAALTTPVLTERDTQIVTLVAEGLKNGQIADRLCVSEATIRNRLTAIFKKLGVKGRFQLVVYACQNKLVKLPSTPGGTAAKLRLV